jgi:RNA polymerase sigma-70 factor, ECF subfamily
MMKFLSTGAGGAAMTEPERSDSELMAAVAGGSREALAQLVRRHQAAVFALALRFLGRWDVAEDIVQDVFIRVWRGAARYQAAAQFTTWLHRITVNGCLDARRRSARGPVTVPEAGLDAAACDPPDPIEARETAGQVRRALDALPERQRMALVLHRYEGLSHRKIAHATGWSESAVESLLVRGYAAMRAALADLDESVRIDRGKTSP